MDLLKYPLEKLFFFAAGIIPGFVALVIFHISVPGSFAWFFSMVFLGYKTKLSITVLAAFVIGNSLTTFLNSVLGGFGGAIGGWMSQKPYKPPHTYPVAPWRDLLWRTALKRRLGAQAPSDTTPLSEPLLQIRRESIEQMPIAERPAALFNLDNERRAAEMADLEWSQWYWQYHHEVLSRTDKWDIQRHVMHGLNFNLETSALYILISVAFVPSVRHWWCILFASAWVLLLILENYWSISRTLEPWSTLSMQIRYLSEYDNPWEADTA